MRNKLHAARSLSFEEWKLFWQAWFLLLAVDIGLRLLPFHRLQAWLRGRVTNQEGIEPSGAEAVIEQTWRIVNIAARNHLYAMTCLRRALVMQKILAGHNIQAELRFGFIKKDNGLNAHAWIEYGGRSFGKNQFHVLISVAATV